ncbi:MAG: hypothetical protein LBI05_00135 [Planctomycetaceae bacterium]|jgi:hypothetical protein|nr:hypothetical protein [Planctomycetaceae bacterium]
MIKITRNDGTKDVILTVTSGAYESIYKKQGFVPFEDKTAAEEPPTVAQKSDDDLFLDAVEMKPISKWSNKEMQRYAALKGIDPKSADLREAIKEAIENGRD